MAVTFIIILICFGFLSVTAKQSKTFLNYANIALGNGLKRAVGSQRTISEGTFIVTDCPAESRTMKAVPAI